MPLGRPGPLSRSSDLHASQLDGVCGLLDGDRRFILGQHGHEFPTYPGFEEMAVAWLDDHPRGGLALASDVAD